MAVPGAGLLALLRKRSDPQLGVLSPPPPVAVAPPESSAAAAAAGSKFEARSSAVHALEQAVAAGTVGEAARPVAQGRRIPPGPSYTYDVDVHVPHEAQPQLPVTPVTLINTDYALHHYRQNAVSGEYICYGLKQGHIRVLSRHSAVRALLKGHTKPLTDLEFAGGSNGADGEGRSLLASGGQDGQLFVWQLWLDEDSAAIHECHKLQANFVTAAGSAGNVFLSWHPSRQVLAAGVGGKVLLVSVPVAGMEQLEFDLEQDSSTPDVTVLPDWTGEAVTCLAFSPDGRQLAVGGAAGSVRVWQLESAQAASAGGFALQAAGSAAVNADCNGGVGAVRWLPHCSGGGEPALLTGNHNNSRLQLWYVAAPGGEYDLLHTLQFEGKDGQQEFFNHAEVVPSQQLVVLADTARKAVYTLRYSGAGADLRFDYVARFGVAVPILSFSAMWNPAGGEQADKPVVELNCVQTTAIQQYSLDPLLCFDGSSSGGREQQQQQQQQAAEAVGAHGRELLGGIRAQPSTAVPMPSDELANGTPKKQAGAAAAALAEEQQAAAVAAAERAAEPVAVPVSESEEAEPAGTAAAGPAEEAAAEEAAPPMPTAEPSIGEAVSLLAGIPPPPAPEPEPPAPKGESGEVTPEECPSPPPTPTEQQRLQQEAAAEEAAAAAAMAAAATAAAVPPPAPRLLTPSDLMLESAGSSAATSTTGRSSPAGETAPVRILQRPGSAAAAAPAAPVQAAAADEEEEEEEREVAPEEVVIVEEPAAAPAAAAVAPAAAPAAAAPAAAVAGEQLDAAVAAAVVEQMGGVHKKFVGHVSLMYRELLKAMKAELNAQAAAQQQATTQLLAAALEAQKQQIEAERAAVLAEERGNIERLLTAISETLNRDLPARLQEAVRGELAGLADSVAASVAGGVAPAVQQAVAATLPKELGGALKGLDKQLAPAVTAGLSKPLQEALRTAFTKQVVPAFEGATQAMFQQINATFSTGLEEHLQASKSALSEPAQLASQLTQALASAQSLATALSQGQQQLLRAQSLGSSADVRSPAAPVDVKAELTALVRAGKYDKAFSKALSLQDVATVGWLCTQADAAAVLGADPCPLSQMVLLSLVQQLSADLTTNLSTKLTWIREAALVLNPRDPALARHLRPVLESVYAALQAAAGRVQGADASSCRLAMHVVHSQMTS